jgi:hypothetical protein
MQAGWGDIEWSINHHHYKFRSAHDVVIPEPQHTITFCIQPARSHIIPTLATVRPMLRSINLHNQARCQTGKICDVGTDHDLPPNENDCLSPQAVEDGARELLRHLYCTTATASQTGV